jgi:hypothetical protein
MVLRDLKSEVMVRRPSMASKTRVFWGWWRRAVTRTSNAEDWMEGGKDVSRRSRIS